MEPGGSEIGYLVPERPRGIEGIHRRLPPWKHLSVKEEVRVGNVQFKLCRIERGLRDQLTSRRRHRQMPPYEDRSTKSDLLSSSDDATGIGAVDDDHPGPHTMTVQLKRPGKVTLEMTKSMMPIYSKSKSGATTRVITHTFAIITTTPRSPLIMDITPKGAEMEIPTIAMSEPDSDGVARPPRKTVLPNPSSPIRAISKALPEATNLDKTSLGSDLDLDTPTYEKPQHVALGTPARPMIFQKDGSVKRQQSAFPDGATDNGKSLDVNILLNTTDWSKTGLGPMESWPQSLKSAGESHAV
jgi:hypothetical protein